MYLYLSKVGERSCCETGVGGKGSTTSLADRWGVNN